MSDAPGQITALHPSFPPRRRELAADLVRGEAALTALLAHRSAAFRGGQVVLPPSKVGGAVHRIASGWCARVRYLPDGRSQILSVLLPGDYLNMSAVFQSEQHDEIVALEPVAIDSVAHGALRDAAMADPALMLRIGWHLLENERRLSNWVVALGQGASEERLAMMLLDLRGRLALRNASAEALMAFSLPLTQFQISELLGLTAVHVNRTIRRFRERGLAIVSRGEARLLDLPELYKLARPMLDTFERARAEYGGGPAAGEISP